MVELFAADIVLSQSSGPTISSVAGGLAEDSTVGGTSDIEFDAADNGSGVYEAVFQVDGQIVSRGVINENGGHCHDVGGTIDGLPAFLYTQPCPASVSVDLPFDTTELSNGTHHLVVTVLDAAGNDATVLSRDITVANSQSQSTSSSTSGAGTSTTTRGAANGTNASEHASLTARWKNTENAHLTDNYGTARTIEGQLTNPEGAPIAGAQIEVSELPSYTGAKARTLTAPHTGAQGKWSLQLPKGSSSSELRFAYRSHIGDALPAATRTLMLTVHAALELSVQPSTASSQGTIHFKGRLLGEPIPTGGKQLVLEARSPGGKWIEFHVLHTGKHGRFSSSYSFRLAGPAKYQFRAVCEAEADFPFAAGSSNVVGVQEQG